LSTQTGRWRISVHTAINALTLKQRNLVGKNKHPRFFECKKTTTLSTHMAPGLEVHTIRMSLARILVFG
jgi:hypothetical protein